MVNRNYSVAQFATHDIKGRPMGFYIIKSGMTINEARQEADRMNRAAQDFDLVSPRRFFAFNPHAE